MGLFERDKRPDQEKVDLMRYNHRMKAAVVKGLLLENLDDGEYAFPITGKPRAPTVAQARKDFRQYTKINPDNPDDKSYIDFMAEPAMKAEKDLVAFLKKPETIAKSNKAYPYMDFETRSGIRSDIRQVPVAYLKGKGTAAAKDCVLRCLLGFSKDE